METVADSSSVHMRMKPRDSPDRGRLPAALAMSSRSAEVRRSSSIQVARLLGEQLECVPGEVDLRLHTLVLCLRQRSVSQLPRPSQPQTVGQVDAVAVQRLGHGFWPAGLGEPQRLLVMGRAAREVESAPHAAERGQRLDLELEVPVLRRSIDRKLQVADRALPVGAEVEQHSSTQVVQRPDHAGIGLAPELRGGFERRAVVLDGLVERSDGACRLTRAVVIAQGALVLAGGSAVQRQQAHDGVKTIGVQLLHRLGRAQVHLLPAALEHALVGRVPNEGVAEAEGRLGPAGLRAHEVGGLEHLHGPRGPALDEPVEQRKREPAPEHRRGAQHLLDLGASRSRRASTTFSTVSGTSAGVSLTNAQPDSVRESDPASAIDRTSCSR